MRLRDCLLGVLAFAVVALLVFGSASALVALRFNWLSEILGSILLLLMVAISAVGWVLATTIEREAREIETLRREAKKLNQAIDEELEQTAPQAPHLGAYQPIHRPLSR